MSSGSHLTVTFDLEYVVVTRTHFKPTYIRNTTLQGTYEQLSRPYIKALLHGSPTA